ncbi:MAG: fibronectin type III domain-containing protein [Chloroflexi bacterium]|nr:fibronectin type III domain-containing protein [Chloroflexota bacterium]
MKVTTGGKGTYSRRGLLRTGVLVALALGIALTLLLAARPAAADGPFGFLIPIILEEFRTPPDVIADDLPSVREVQAAQTQTSTPLVSNTGRPASNTPQTFTRDFAQAFTTGGNSSGYTLTSVQLNLKFTDTQPNITMTIHEDSSGVPASTSLGTLGMTGLLQAGSFRHVQFDASGAGIDLRANKTYWVVVDVPYNAPDTQTEYRSTTSDSEDSGSATDWSIADNHRYRGYTFSTWVGAHAGTEMNPVHLRVNGSVNPPPPPPPDTAPKLVSSIGQTRTHALGLLTDYARGFSTGSNDGGYKLTSVEIYLRQGGSNTPQPDYSVYIARDSSEKPGATLGTLTTSTELTADWTRVEFTATGDDIYLDTDSTYWVVVDAKDALTLTSVGARTDAVKDSGAAAGWSLADGYQWRPYGGGTWVGNTGSYPMVAVHGNPIMDLPVTGLRQTSDNDGYDRCATILMEWNDPGRTDFTGYKVVVTHPDKSTTILTADNFANQANTSAIVQVRQPSATRSQTYKIDVYSYQGTNVGKTASRTVTVPKCAPPGPPRSLRLTGIDQSPINPSSMKLTWTVPSNAATVGVREYSLEQLRDGYTDWETEAEQISTVRSDSGVPENDPSTSVRSYLFSAPSMMAGDTRQYRLSAVRYVRFPTNTYPDYPYPENPLDHTLSLQSNPSNTVSFKHLTAPASPWLTAETDGDGAVLLNWAAPSDDGGAPVTSFQLQRSAVAGETMPEDDSGWTNLSAPSSRQYRHTGLTAGATWHYRMRARNSEDWSGWHYAQATIPEGGLPNAPRLTARSSGTTVELSWTEPDDIGTSTETETYEREDCNDGNSWTASDRGNFVCHYEVQMQEDDGGWPTSSVVANDYRNSHRPTLLRITIDEQSQEYQLLRPGASYKFRVRAVTSLVQEHESRYGAWSNVRTASVPGGPTMTVTLPIGGPREIEIEYEGETTIVTEEETDEEIPVTPNRPEIEFDEKEGDNAGSHATITWSLPSDAEGSASGYVLEWENPTGGSWARLTTTGGSTTSYTHRNLSPSTRYAYRVAVRYGSGVGPYSRSGSGISPGVAFPPDPPKGVRVTSINTTGFNIAWDRSPAASKYTPATARYVFGLCERGTEKRTFIDRNGIEQTADAPVIRCNASQSTTGTTGRITAEPGERIFAVAAVNSRGQSDWTKVFVSVPAAATEGKPAKSLSVSRTSLSLNEGDYDRGGSYTVRLVNPDDADSGRRLSIDSGYDKDALITWECTDDCILTGGDDGNSHTVTVTVHAMWDDDTNDGVLVFHNEVEGVASGPSVRVAVRDRVQQ